MKKIFLLLLLITVSKFSFGACDQTISTGSNVATVVLNAAAGTTICLNAGNYGSINFNNITKSSDVIVQSTSGITASISPNIGSGSTHIKFQNLTISGMNISGSTTKNITISGSTFTSGSRVDTANFNNNNILIDGNTFDNIDANGGYEGRLQISWGGGPGSVSSGVTITNNHFGGGGCSDGIQIGSYGVVVGPGNVFDGILQGSCAEHVDAIQGYGQSHTVINGNFFTNNTIHIGIYDGGNTETMTNNVFANGSGQPIQLGGILGGSFSHNTLKGNWVVSNNTKASNTQTRDVAWQNNIFTGGSSINETNGDQHGCSSGCVFSYNLFDVSGNSKGTNVIIGTPTFTGGASPSTWAGWQLTSGSLGYQNGSDSLNRGTTYYGPSSGGDTTAPTVSVTAPTQSSTVSGTISVTASASDDVGVVGVQFKLDGSNLQAEDTSSPYSISWDTTTVNNGTHTIIAIARDAAGNSTTSSTRTFTTSNSGSAPPTVNSVGCSPTTIQAPGSTVCTPTITGVYTSVSWSQQSCLAAQCTTASTTNSATYNCSYGGACTMCANATNSFGTGNTACASAIVVKYKKPSNFRTL